jgi:SPP1 family predicted phage head-tail adaptor
MPSSKPLRAEQRNNRVTFRRLKKTDVPNPGGHLDESDPANWETFWKEWASITPRGSREFFRREQVAADITHQVETLYNAQMAKVTSGMRIEFGGRILNISEPPRNIDENNHSLVFACIEVK